ncbi:hypothetical protein [Mesobacillus zeae]|uniref:Uncharacterized protein n=1 Tax=Mesobacillus zeae TaxID=1917180 RepID=A0A398B5H7_9BACI|nr:hypothetical protein [Mesobacillus zeae]RID84684.1 hypothetical protein D1970_12430 [Mesobacillus zeae]
MKNLYDRPKWIVWAFVLLFLIAITSPFWLWQLKASSKLDVLIFDKTVPDRSYREHKGLTWILNNEKYVKTDGSSYSAANDYIGFKPEKNSGYRVDELTGSLAEYDLFYFADQYGVYKEEYEGQNPKGERSELLYGGLKQKDVEKVQAALNKGGKTIISEFNTFGSPTAETVRNGISNIHNIDWSGWNGRFFQDLGSREVPLWIKDQYTKESGKWNFTGAGFIFVNQDDYIAVVSDQELSDKDGASFSLTKPGDKFFRESYLSQYQYWFDIVSARNEEEVLATYRLPLNQKGKEKLAGYGIPESFPAVIRHHNARYSAYYFAGDYADEAEVPGLYQTKGLTDWKRNFSAKNSFYWNTYVPMMKEILNKGMHGKVKSSSAEVSNRNGISYNGRTDKNKIQVLKDGKWQDITIKGVNMGIGKPGYFPGETAITKDEYLRWLKAIGAMNANSLRIYTLHPPEFYEAFYEYNQTAEHPLYLFHGAWVNEEMLVEAEDAYSEGTQADFKREIRQMIDIIHGNAEIAPVRGHASGKYAHDISQYVLGFIIGIEWDPEVVSNTDMLHKGMRPYKGEYFMATEQASPFESWITEMMDYTAAYETKQYNWQHTMSFTNWVTTDLLEHPNEPLEKEDLATVNPNHIKNTSQFGAGLFASYHVYPYYPDSLHYEKKYTDYMDKEGKKNHYAGYLHDLISAHRMPLVVAEFGVPASRGMTHENHSGMNQGNLSEDEQGRINVKLFKSILSEGGAGGMVFTWQDEWFKRTWNTMDYDNPDRRPYWPNVQTNEQNFGLLSFEPGRRGSELRVDGNREDWDKKKAKPAFKSKKGFVKDVYFTSDEGYLYYMLELNEPADWDTDHLYLLMDIADEQGQHHFELEKGVQASTDLGIDFKLELTGNQTSRLMVDSYYDPFYFQYGNILKMIPEKEYARKKGNGIFHPIKLALNKAVYLPKNKETLPFQSYETGRMRFGNANPSSPQFDSLADICLSKDKRLIEGRIPWQLLNVKDPSTKEIMGDLWKKGLQGSEKTEGINMEIAAVRDGKLSETIPVENEMKTEKGGPLYYTWDEWEQPTTHERLKKSYVYMKKAYGEPFVQEGKSE